jgi:phosphoribosylaminoimidazole-succinocarboxamide synthase
MQADTKFEFGLDEETDEIYLVDEVLTYVSISLEVLGIDG